MTGQDIFEITMDIIDERLDSGELSEDYTISYKVKAPGILNQLQAQIIDTSRYFKSYEKIFKALTLIGGTTEIEEHDNEDVSINGSDKIRSYSFSVDGTATIYIEDYTTVWNTLATINTTDTELTDYTGTVTPTAGATKSRVRFSGTYYYHFTNVGLYNQSFVTVPMNKEYRKIDMPSDFSKLIELNSNDIVMGDYKWENNSLYVSKNFTGKLRINYKPIPTLIEDLDDTIVVEDVIARTILPYGLASNLILHEDEDKANFFEQKYQEALALMNKPIPAVFTTIQDEYGVN